MLETKRVQFFDSCIVYKTRRIDRRASACVLVILPTFRNANEIIVIIIIIIIIIIWYKYTSKFV